MKLTTPPVHFGYRQRLEYPEDLPGPWVHAELAAYRKAVGVMDRSRSFECINIAFTKTGVRMSCPCETCQTLLLALGCTRVYFTTKHGWGNLRLQ